MVRSFSGRSGLFATVDCSSWEDFRLALRGVLPSVAGGLRISDQFLFRGQSCSSWGLVSAFDRHFAKLAPAERDRKYVELMRLFQENYKVYGGLGSRDANLEPDKFDARTPTEREAVAQHYGLSTRLLDWSFSPYVAAFFSASRLDGNTSGRVSIWALYREAADWFSKSEFEITRDFYTGNVRNLWQMGAFTRNHTANVDSVNLFSKASGSYDHAYDLGQPALLRFDIPVSTVEEMVDDLQLMRINSMTIFPGIEGVVSWIKRKSGM